MFKNFKQFQIWRPAVTDPYTVRPCNYKGLWRYPVETDPEGFSPVPISRLEI